MNLGRILIVDGAGAYRSLLQAYLAERGHIVAALADGREALARFEELDPALVVTDLQAGGLDGLDFIAALRRRPRPPSVLLCTPLRAAAQWSRDVLEVLGIDDVVLRPAAFPELAVTAEKLLEQRALAHPAPAKATPPRARPEALASAGRAAPAFPVEAFAAGGAQEPTRPHAAPTSEKRPPRRGRKR